ncbi:3-hydroxyacyl-ACP dehydratase [Streptomyces sp. NPDC006704]|uniref:3-hydroxyacyl-ACP dehydratase n=1 Tax=Streptomyces sp. NPDC006704 TaxID=3364760 RepID=UPI0036C4FF2F
MDDLSFDASCPVIPWWPDPAVGDTARRPSGLPARAPGLPAPASCSTRAAALAEELAATVRTAHHAALRAHQALQEALLAPASRAPLTVLPTAPVAIAPRQPSALRATLTWCPASPMVPVDDLRVTEVASADEEAWEVRHEGLTVARVTGRRAAPAPTATPWPLRQLSMYPRQFRPLTHSVRDRLGRAELDRLAAGDLAGVLGASCAAAEPPRALGATAFALLDEVVVTGSGTGRHGQGRVTATTPGGRAGTPDWVALLTAAWQALHVHALHQGLHLCLPGPSVTPWTEECVHIEVRDGARLSGPLLMAADIVSIGLVPRPHVVADVSFGDGRTTTARLRGVGCVLREPPGRELGPGDSAGGTRRTPDGRQVFAHELHMAHASEGDLSVAHGAARHRSACLIRPRLPRGDLLMLDRMIDAPAAPGSLLSDTSYVTEYDVPHAPWYVDENAGDVPHLALLEMSLQAAAFVGASLGACTEYPDQNLTVRNLEGSSRLVRAVDLRGRTVRQRTTVLSHTPLPGALLQRYRYELAVGGETFYTGETVHGFFTEPVLAQQQGLDGGRLVAPWLRRQSPPPLARPPRPTGEHPAPSGRLAFLEGADVSFVADGGRYSLGYVLCDKPIDPDDWYFGRHFLHDPVMPGSCGVELLFQMARVCLRSAGISTDATPEPRPALGAELRWTYRGQIQPHHRALQAEVHLREVIRTDAGTTALAEGSVWRDGLRIYAVDDIALEVPGGTTGRRAS